MHACRMRRTNVWTSVAFLLLTSCLIPNALSQTSEIKLWVFVSSSELVQFDPALLALLQEYEAAEHMSVVVTRIEWRDALSALQMAANARGDESFLPDVVQMPSSFLARFADNNTLVEIDRHQLDGYYLRAAQTCKIEGKDKVYAIPWYQDSRFLFFEKLKGKNGEDLIGDPLMSFSDWDSFRNTCVRIRAALENAEGKEKNRSVFSLPIERDFDLLHQLAALVSSYGGDIVEKKHLWFRCTLDGPGGRSATHLLQRLFEEGCLALPRMNRDALERSFVSGRGPVVMMSGPWLARRLEDAYGAAWRERFGVALVPKGPSKEYHAFLGGSHLAVFKTAQKRGNYERALRLIRFMTQSDAALKYTEAKGQIPVYARLIEKYAAIEQENRIFVQGMAQGRSYPSIPRWASVMDQAAALEDLSAFWSSISNGDTARTASDLSAMNTIIDEQLYKAPRNEFAIRLLLVVITFVLAGASVFGIKQSRLIRRLKREELDFVMHQRRVALQQKFQDFGDEFTL